MQEKINQEEQKSSPPILTPKKQVQGNQRQYQTKRYYKFKGIEPQNLYIPKLRVNSLKSSELSLAYVYKVNSLEHIGSVQQWSDGKHKQNSEQKNSNQMISQVKRKGIRDYTMFIKRSQQERDSQLSSIFIIGTSTFKSDKILNYFQIKLLEISEDSLACFSFGVTNSQQSLASSKNSISLSCKLTSQRTLQIYRNNNKMQQINDFRIKLQDTIGCGFIYHRNQIFITHNKHIILDRLKLYIPQSHEDKQNKQPKPIKQFMQVHNHRYYPFIQLQSKKISIQVIFQNSHQCFKFPYLEQVNNLKSRLMDEETVKSADMSDESIYGLVLSYFKFNGYDKASQLGFQAEMMKRDMKFYPQNYPIRNKLQYGKRQQSQVLDETRKIFQLGKQKKIRKKTRKNHSERLRRSLEQDLLLQVPQMIDQVSHRGSDQDSQQNKERSQSDQYQQNYCKSISQSRNKKKVLEHTEQLVDKQKIQFQQRRKQEVNSYLNKKIQKKFEEMKRTSQQKYKTQRIQIMKNIQDGKIDQALKLFSKAYKIILSKYKYLQVFFKAHLFLKYYNQQGLQKALQFAKKQHKSFTQYQNYLMPFFNNKSLKNQGQNQYEYRPLREILFLICPEKKEQFNIQRQFYVFSQFISQFICQYSGFHGMSKLELVLNSYRVVEKKISQLEVPIGGFDLQSMGLI